MPLPKEAPIALRSIPEYLVEDAAEFFLFVTRYVPPSLHSAPLVPLLNFTVMFLSQPDYIKSPHLRAKFAELLFTFTPEYHSQSQSGFSSLEYLFSSNDFILKNLAKSLMDFYQGIGINYCHKQQQQQQRLTRPDSFL